MNKTKYTIFFLLFLFYSCHKDKAALPPKLSGKINTISVVIDNQLWNGEIGENIRNNFAAPVIGLPQEEPLFTINQFPLKLMEGFIYSNKNIIIVQKENKVEFAIKKNKFESVQNIFHISGKTNRDILEILHKFTPKIISIIKEGEVAESQRIHKKSLINVSPVKQKFGVSLEIPRGYIYALQNNNFLWLKKEIYNGSTSLLIYEVPINAFKNNINIIGNVINMRDSIGKLYIRGIDENTPMITEESYAPYLFKSKLDGKLTYETRGTWELQNDFMSGPFVNYACIDKKHNRILVLEGFCYSPSNKGRDLMHELEAIVKSVVIL